MEIKPHALSGVCTIVPNVFSDERGYFFETYNVQQYQRIIPEAFVQDNESYSIKNVLRGLHFQLPPYAQGKLVRVVSGEVLDVAVDIRLDSPTFGQTTSEILSAENKRQLWIPPGLAHGFIVRSDAAVVSYKCTALYEPTSEGILRWDDPDVAIDWGVTQPIVSEKDTTGMSLGEVKEMLQNV